MDDQGRTRIVLSAKAAVPGISLLREDGQAAASLTVSNTGHAALNLHAVGSDHPAAVIEIDPKGTHVKFTHPSGATTYFFRNNEGVSGLVMQDTTGKRRINIMVPVEGPVQFQPLDE